MEATIEGPERGAREAVRERFALGEIRAPRVPRREQRAVRDVCERRGERLAEVADAAGIEHRLVLVGSRRPGAERFLCDVPAAGAARCVGVFRADDAVDGALDALLRDYTERLGREERPLCRPVRLVELVASTKEVSDGDPAREERREASEACRRAYAALGLDSGVEGPIRLAG